MQVSTWLSNISFIFNLFGCKLWLQSIQNHARHSFKVFTHSHLKSLCCLLGIWADCITVTPFSRTGCQFRSAALHRIQFGTCWFVHMPYFYSETIEWLKNWAKKSDFVAPFCTLCKSENIWTCENSTQNTCDSCMSVCFLTCATCKKVWHSKSHTLGPGPLAKDSCDLIILIPTPTDCPEICIHAHLTTKFHVLHILHLYASIHILRTIMRQ